MYTSIHTYSYISIHLYIDIYIHTYSTYNVIFVHPILPVLICHDQLYLTLGVVCAWSQSVCLSVCPSSRPLLSSLPSACPPPWNSPLVIPFIRTSLLSLSFSPPRVLHILHLPTPEWWGPAVLSQPAVSSTSVRPFASLVVRYQVASALVQLGPGQVRLRYARFN